ncbi:MAG: YdcF family protein, partial [Patescibacteria group bacterium]
MTDREKFLILIYNEPLKKANAIILLQGDGYFRIPWAYKLYKEKWAPRIVVSSDIKNLTYGSYPNLAKKLKEAGVPSKNIITELQ